jgi:PBP1b-binding outer membrane lipoprotein LpoB
MAKYRKLTIGLFTLILLLSGCVGQEKYEIDDSYHDAPEEIKDGSLDYKDYKETDCPYLEGSLDSYTMEKCNKWIRNNYSENES